MLLAMVMCLVTIIVILFIQALVEVVARVYYTSSRRSASTSVNSRTGTTRVSSYDRGGTRTSSYTTDRRGNLVTRAENDRTSTRKAYTGSNRVSSTRSSSSSKTYEYNNDSNNTRNSSSVRRSTTTNYNNNYNNNRSAGSSFNTRSAVRHWRWFIL